MLEVIHHGKESIAGIGKVGGLGIRDASHFERIVVDPPFHILVFHSADYYVTLHPFKNRRVGIVREVIDRKLDGYQFIFLVVPVVKMYIE